jgi:hypothetical protein
MFQNSNSCYAKIIVKRFILTFRILSEKAGINEKIYDDILNTMLKNTDLVKKLTFSSFLYEKTQRNYFHSYQTRLNIEDSFWVFFRQKGT